MITSPNFNISLHVGPKSKPTFTSTNKARRRRTRRRSKNEGCPKTDAPDASVPLPPGSMGRDKGRGKPLPWEVGWVHVKLKLFSETLTTAAQRAGGIIPLETFIVRQHTRRPVSFLSCKLAELCVCAGSRAKRSPQAIAAMLTKCDQHEHKHQQQQQ